MIIDSLEVTTMGQKSLVRSLTGLSTNWTPCKTGHLDKKMNTFQYKYI